MAPGTRAAVIRAGQMPGAAEHRSERILSMCERGADTYGGPRAAGVGAVACMGAADSPRVASRALLLR